MSFLVDYLFLLSWENRCATLMLFLPSYRRFYTFLHFLFIFRIQYTFNVVIKKSIMIKTLSCSLDVSVEMLEELDLSTLRGHGQQAGEELLPEDEGNANTTGELMSIFCS